MNFIILHKYSNPLSTVALPVIYIHCLHICICLLGLQTALFSVVHLQFLTYVHGEKLVDFKLRDSHFVRTEL
jgi:hypothetical protein